MNNIPESVQYVVIGAGVHGLSTAWHLAKELEARRQGSGEDIVVLDKSGPGSGASGIACGCVRNFYMTEPIHALLRHSVDVWQNSVGYHSDLFVGDDARRFLKKLWPDFKTQGIDVAIHEKVSGYAGTHQVIRGLVQKCGQLGVKVVSSVEVTQYNVQGGQVKSIVTNQGEISCDLIIWGLGAWTPIHWEMLDQPTALDCHYPDGSVSRDKDMWTYWRLLEGEVYYSQPYVTPDGKNPPVLHVEKMNTPVIDEMNGHVLRDYTYVYFKNGNERMDRPGIQGGTIPVKIGPLAAVDPYGHENDEYQAEAEFADYLCSAMAQTMSRFENCRSDFRERRNGGIGAFTPDNVPVFDWVLPNVYMIADSNHGFKMLGAGKLVARYLAGDDVPELKSFAFSRFKEGGTFGSTNSHSPWV
jgi:glycine/D-amino acid oxidase-like deaminating enzyme